MRRPWLGWSPRVTMGLVILLLAVIAAETVMLRQQYLAGATTRAQANRLRAAFLLSDSAQVSRDLNVYIRLQNVRFTWSDKVYIDAGNMTVRAAPIKGTTVDFDDVNSFSLNLQQSVVLIRPSVLAGMFNESIFNYPGSRVRHLKVAIVKNDRGEWTVRLDGKLGMVAYVPFTMFTRLSVDQATNTLVIEVDHLKMFGIIPATKIIRWTPLNIDRLIELPPNGSLMVDGNRIMVKPLALFPPPRINGRMSKIEVAEDAIRITFAGGEIPAPQSTASNYVFLRGGASRFGHFLMTDTDVLILDQDMADPFVFSLLHYADQVPRSVVRLADTKSVQITMPDFPQSPPAGSPSNH